ncbi:MAG: acyl-CoA thioesterase [Gemmatimonadetes bacterium]|nr:acyl-CoA thioesterase [Gemmatimonadota bacterium]
MGVVYHAHYLVWMEVGRTELLRALGHPYAEIERAGLLFAVLDVRCRFAGSARYGDTVRVRTRIDEVRSRDVTFGYEIVAEGGAPIATSSVRVLALDGGRRPRRIPAPLLADLRTGAGRVSRQPLGEAMLA